MAQSTSCPGCHKPVMVADEVLNTGQRRGPIRELRTCGKVVIGKRARLICENIVAHGGIECQGIIDAKHVIAGPGLFLGPKANFRGELHAGVVVMESGTVVQPSRFHVPSDPQGLLEERPEAPPKPEPEKPSAPSMPTSSTRRPRPPSTQPGAKPLSATKKPKKP